MSFRGCPRLPLCSVVTGSATWILEVSLNNGEGPEGKYGMKAWDEVLS